MRAELEIMKARNESVRQLIKASTAQVRKFCPGEVPKFFPPDSARDLFRDIYYAKYYGRGELDGHWGKNKNLRLRGEKLKRGKKNGGKLKMHLFGLYTPKNYRNAHYISLTFYENNVRFEVYVAVNNCIQQIELPKSLHVSGRL